MEYGTRRKYKLQVLHGYYYEHEGNDFLHQRLVKKYQSNSAGQNCNLLL